MNYIKLCLLSLFVGYSICAQCQDWAELNHYKEDNNEIQGPSKDENRVVFMGNSITAGWVGAMPEFFKGKPYIGRGIGGQTTPQMLIRFRQDVISLKPKVVVILAGTNDIAGNSGPSTIEMIEDNIASMSELAESNGIKVILSSVLPVYIYPWKPDVKPIEKINELNHWLEEYAKKNDHVYLDYYSSMVDERSGMKSEYSADGVHPNQIGYKLMGVLVEKAIASTIRKKHKHS